MKRAPRFDNQDIQKVMKSVDTTGVRAVINVFGILYLVYEVLDSFSRR